MKEFTPEWLSAIAALTALAGSAWAGWISNKTRKRTSQLEDKNAELAELQAKLAHQSWSDEYFREISNWASAVCDAISAAIHLPENAPSEERQILIVLSAAIDKGRWYFPNRYHEERGRSKEPAYRGIRQPILDWVVRAYDIVSGRSDCDDRRESLVECQRTFVSCIQEVLDPRSREKVARRVLLEYDDVQRLRGTST